MGIPGAGCTVPFEKLRQPAGIFRQVFKPHGTVLDKGNRLAVPFHRHHDVEPGLSHLPDLFLKFQIHSIDHCTGKPQISHQLVKSPKSGQLRAGGFTGELNQ